MAEFNESETHCQQPEVNKIHLKSSLMLGFAVAFGWKSNIFKSDIYAVCTY